MADQNITALPVTTTPASSDQLLLVGAAEEKLIDYDKLADAILNKLTSKNFSLNQGTMTLMSALNQLNSNVVFGDMIHDGGSINNIFNKANDICVNSIGAENSHSVEGFPNGAYGYGILITFNRPETFCTIQIYVPHNAPSEIQNGAIYIRTQADGSNTKISTWREFTPTSIIEAATK